MEPHIPKEVLVFIVVCAILDSLHSYLFAQGRRGDDDDDDDPTGAVT